MSRVCQICQTRQSRYTCPTCNAPYCSLACFRDEKHAGCSERFYQDSLVQDIQSDRDNKKEDQAKLLEMYGRLQEMDEAADASTSSNADALADKLHDVDLDALQVQDLEKLLSPEQLKQFQDMVKRRDVDQLLADEDQESPWWHAQLHENLPVWLEQYPQDLVPQWNGQMDGSSVVFNVLSALLTYVYLYRTCLELSPEAVLRTIETTAPFLVERTSALSLKSTMEAALYVLSRAGLSDNHAACRSLLEDAAVLIRPQAVSMLSDSDQDAATSNLSAHHNAKLIGALCHLHTFTASAASGSGSFKKKTTFLGHRIRFYLGLAASEAPAFSFVNMCDIYRTTQQLADQYQGDNDEMDKESRQLAPETLLRHRDQQPKNPEIDDSQPKPKIVEIA